MTRAKTSTRKSKTKADHDRYTAELSAGQLVIGMSILLMICLASFLMGVVVGKFDPTLNPEVALQSLPIQEVVTVASSGTQTESPVRTATQTRRAPPPELRTPRSIGNAQTAGGKRASKPKEPKDSAVTSAKAEPAEAKLSMEADKPSRSAPESVKVAQTDAAEAAAQPITKPVQPEATPTKGTRYRVQVAAFTTRRRAEVVKRDLEARSAYKVDLVPSSNGRLVTVVVGSYADLPTAKKVRDDLKLNFGFSDCFVPKL